MRRTVGAAAIVIWIVLVAGVALSASEVRARFVDREDSIRTVLKESEETVGTIVSARVIGRGRAEYVIAYRYQGPSGVLSGRGRIGSRMRFDIYTRRREVPVLYSRTQPMISRPISRASVSAQLIDAQWLGLVVPLALVVVAVVIAVGVGYLLLAEYRKPRTARIVDGEILSIHTSWLHGTRALTTLDDGSGPRTFYGRVAGGESGKKVSVLVDESDSRLLALCEWTESASERRSAQRSFP
jgi:hypothetical protein